MPLRSSQEWLLQSLGCEIRDPLWKIKARIVDALATVSLAELAEPAPAAGSPVAVPMFVRSGATARPQVGE